MKNKEAVVIDHRFFVLGDNIGGVQVSGLSP